METFSVTFSGVEDYYKMADLVWKKHTVDLAMYTRRACERPIRTCIVFLDHVQTLQIHAVRANFHIMFSVGIYSDGPSPGPGLGPSQLTAPFSPDLDPY